MPLPFGCTEPISLAYAAAKARQVLGTLPERLSVEASGSIIKNDMAMLLRNNLHFLIAAPRFLWYTTVEKTIKALR